MEFRPTASINAADLAGVAAKLAINARLLIHVAIHVAINVAINARLLMRGCSCALPRAAAPDISLPRRAQGAGQQQGGRRPARCVRGRDTHFQHAKQNRLIDSYQLKRKRSVCELNVFNETHTFKTQTESHSPGADLTLN